jgi:hypothetical protein
MDTLFKDILSVADVQGAMLFSFKGKLLHKEFLSPLPEEPESKDWWTLLMHSLNGTREVDLVFENSKFYIRKTEVGYLIVVMGVFSQSAMVRLNCDMLLPVLKDLKIRKARKGFFKKR